jgi:dihydroorotase-like cyclic amidohydrolase
MFHCEDNAINTTTKERMIAEGRSAIRYMAESQPVVSEEVATQRAVAMSEVTGAPNDCGSDRSGKSGYPSWRAVTRRSG